MKRTMIKPLIAGFGAALLAAFANLTHAATLDLLVLYDDYTSTYYNGDVKTAMTAWVDQINAAYRDSQVDIQLRLVGTSLHNDASTNMGDVLGHIHSDASLAALRDSVGADFVSQLHKTGSCGIGYVSVDKNWTWTVLAPGCGPMVMAHELGHNMGLNHSRKQGDTSGTRFRYGVGYGVDNTFATIMAYPQVFNAKRVNRFSNPNLVCSGLPCGVPIGQPEEAFAAKAIDNVRDEMALFRPTVGTPTTPATPVKVFQHCDFGGYSATLQVGSYNLAKLISLGVKNDDLSSLQVPKGFRVTLYEHDGFTGKTVIKTQDEKCLVTQQFNDITSSIKIEAI